MSCDTCRCNDVQIGHYPCLCSCHKAKPGSVTLVEKLEITPVEGERIRPNLVNTFKDQRDAAYKERNALVALLSKIFPAHLCRHEESDKDWDFEWRNIVCIHLQSGQVTWHIHDNELPQFSHLQLEENHWDGHTTEEKYERIAAFKTLGWLKKQEDR